MINVKTDTKEKFSVIIPQFNNLTANMAVELTQFLSTFLQKDVPHVVLNLKHIQDMQSHEADQLIEAQNAFYENQCSFIICEIQSQLVPLFNESINITPSESEAWDILQMEEIERELLNNFDDV